MHRPSRAVFALLTTTLSVRVQGPLPFSAAELRSALVARVPTAESVEVTANPAGQAVVHAFGKERVVALEGARGPSAARLVALAVADLATAVEPLPAPPEVRATAPPATTPASARFALLGGGQLDGGQLGAAIDASFRLTGALRLGASAGYGQGPEVAVDQIPVGLRFAPVRAALAWQPADGPLELRAGAVVMPYWLGDGSAMTPVSRNGAIFGGSASALYAVPVGSRLELVLVLGVDAFANRDEFQIHGRTAVATPRVAAWGALGLGFAR